LRRNRAASRRACLTLGRVTQGPSFSLAACSKWAAPEVRKSDQLRNFKALVVADNDVQFEGDTSISRVHAKLSVPAVENLYDVKSVPVVTLQDWYQTFVCVRSTDCWSVWQLQVRHIGRQEQVSGHVCPPHYAASGLLQRSCLVRRPVELKDGCLIQFGTSADCTMKWANALPM
jgi:hypothetical protein